jgi:rhodanese-related sulfurtransferase
MIWKRGKERMSPTAVFERMDEIQVLDVRDAYEWSAGHVEGAVHIPLGWLPQQLDALDRDRPVAVICRSGNRSASATRFLRAQGFDAHNVAGGMVVWSMHGLPVVRDDGRRGSVA